MTRQLYAMSADELGRAVQDLAQLAPQLAAEHPEAVKLIQDAMQQTTEELLARAFGGGAEARAYAARVTRERSH